MAAPNRTQCRLLRQIARSRLIKTRLPDRPEPLWLIDGGEEIPHALAVSLVRNGWVVPQRDGLDMFDETKSYVAQTPATRR